MHLVREIPGLSAKRQFKFLFSSEKHGREWVCTRQCQQVKSHHTSGYNAQTSCWWNPHKDLLLFIRNDEACSCIHGNAGNWINSNSVNRWIRAFAHPNHIAVNVMPCLAFSSDQVEIAKYVYRLWKSRCSSYLSIQESSSSGQFILAKEIRADVKTKVPSMPVENPHNFVTLATVSLRVWILSYDSASIYRFRRTIEFSHDFIWNPSRTLNVKLE